jgi:hypothetical protein
MDDQELRVLSPSCQESQSAASGEEGQSVPAKSPAPNRK